MPLKINPTTGALDLTGASSGGTAPADRFKQIHASLSAFDKIQAITYDDAGQAYERIASVTYTSTSYPDANMTKVVTWLDAGTMNQRIQKEEFTASVISPDSLRKNYSYTAVGIRYRRTGYTYETF